jgi:large subunit ribosomal protein L10
MSCLFLQSDPIIMGRTLENKQQIVGELKGLLAETELALVLDFKGLSIKEMSDLRDRLRVTNSVCKVTKNTLMRRAIDGDSSWANLDSLLTGYQRFRSCKRRCWCWCKGRSVFPERIQKV